MKVTPVTDMYTRSSVEPFESVYLAAALTCVIHRQEMPVPQE